MKITVGADPEFFLMRNKEVVPAVGLVPGTKEKPHRLKNGAVQLDGTAVEFNIDPAETPVQFKNNILDVLEQVRDMIPKDYSFAFQPSVIYSTQIWSTIPESARELGCNPDYDAYTGLQKTPPPLSKNLHTMRTGAGHIHIGFTDVNDAKDPSHLWDCICITKALDKVFGCFVREFDTDRQRRQLYGQLGSFRPKPYGLEYRVLSNAWLRYPDMWEWIFTTTQATMNALENGLDISRQFIPFYYDTLANRNKYMRLALGSDYNPFSTEMVQRNLAM